MASPRPNPGTARRPESVYTTSSLAGSPGVPASGSDVNLSDTRKKQVRRDEAIRKKIETELSRKRPGSQKPSGPGGRKGGGRRQAGTVSALRPLPALTVPDSISVADASQLCAAKRTDCVLVVDEDEHLCGIFTAKDLAFRVVGDGLDPRTTPVSAIMTRNPMVTRDTTSATDALQTMVSKGFRHLPVCNEEGDVVGLLDITKVFNESLEKLERAYGSSQKLYTALEGVQSEWGPAGPGTQANGLMAYVEALRDKMSFPDLGSILDARTTPATVGVKTSVRDAAKLMREHHTTAVCVMENEGKKIAGIFTSKDVVLRVIAAGLDAKTCSVVRVMTPHPDTALPSLSIQEALRKMHDGHYLNLPVVEEEGRLIGIVDVLKLTYATLEQVNSIGADQGQDASAGPLWGRFFASFGAGTDVDTESVMSDHHTTGSALPSTPSHHHNRPGGVLDSPEVFPGDSASAYNDDGASELAMRGQQGNISSLGQQPIVDDGTYLFKFLAPGGTTHRFQARYDNFDNIKDIIAGKLGADSFFREERDGEYADPKDFQLRYKDDDGDMVMMTGDRDVTDAVTVAKKQGVDRVVLHLTGGKGWENEMTKVEPKPAPAPPVAVVPESEDDEKPKKKGKEVPEDDLAFGILPKEMVLPASIAFLGVAIIGVFAASRMAK